VITNNGKKKEEQLGANHDCGNGFGAIVDFDLAGEDVTAVNCEIFNCEGKGLCCHATI
jgi:hypothetical protein